MSETWNQSQNHFQSLDAIDRLRDSLREEHGLMLQVSYRDVSVHASVYASCDLTTRTTLQYVLAIWRKLFTPIQAASLVANMDAEVTLIRR